jgi:O-antigen/teichoic acid export membrane protein
MKKVIDRIKELLSYAADIGFFHLVSANMLLQIAGAGMTLVLVRILSQDDIGRISILQSFYAIFIQISLLGLNTTIIKLCSEKIEETEKEEILITAVKINIIVSLSVVLFVIGTSFFNIYDPSDEVINQVIRVYILQIPFIVLNFLSIAYLQAQSKIKLMSRYQVITRIFVIIAVIICSYFWALDGYVAGIVIANIFAFFLILS